MKIIKANITHADMIGEIHTKAWMQTYKDLFPTEYLSQESKEKRVEEFRNNRQENVEYYLLMEKDIGIGMFKLFFENEVCELSSIYLLKEYCHRGYGTECINYIKNKYPQYTITLWTLEENRNARRFYEKNNFYDTGNRRMINRGNDYIQIQLNLLRKVGNT